MNQLVPLGDLVSISGGGTPSRKKAEFWGGPIPWATVKDLNSQELSNTQEFITEEAVRKSATNIIPAGTVITATRMGLGRAAINTVEMAINQDLKALRCDEKLYSRYLLYFLTSKAEHLESMGKGATVKGIKLEELNSLKIPLPPLSEQKRIAAILDKADAIRKKRKKAIDLTETFLRSAFLEMFGDPVTNPKGWEIAYIGEVSFRVTKGESPKWQGHDYLDSGIRFVTSENVLWGTLDMSKDKYIPEEFHKKISRSALAEDDLLINIVGASIGRTCIVPKRALPANVNQAVAVVTVDKSILLPCFVLFQLLTDQVQRVLLGHAVESARANISLTDIRELPIIVPPLEQQNKWQKLMSRMRRIEDTLSNNQVAMYDLFNSLTQRAFGGEL